MPRRAPSPAQSENEVDIAGSLFANEADGDGDVDVKTKKPGNGALDLDFNSLLNATGDGESDDDGGDEAFIAFQQRSSNRKASNLQGKSVKKGGGFQAMGEQCPAFPSRVLMLGLTYVCRPQCESPKSHRPERLLSPHSHPAKSDPPDPGEERCRGHGEDRLWQDGRLRDPHD